MRWEDNGRKLTRKESNRIYIINYITMDYWKLIELLNEHQKGKEKSEQAKDYEVYEWKLDSWWGIARYDVDDPREWHNLYSDVTPSYITSKSFWFIQWLVENEKIEWNNKDIAIKEWILWKSIDNYHSLLMALAIQDEPIEFLISLLKNV